MTQLRAAVSERTEASAHYRGRRPPSPRIAARSDGQFGGPCARYQVGGPLGPADTPRRDCILLSHPAAGTCGHSRREGHSASTDHRTTAVCSTIPIDCLVIIGSAWLRRHVLQIVGEAVRLGRRRRHRAPQRRGVGADVAAEREVTVRSPSAACLARLAVPEISASWQDWRRVSGWTSRSWRLLGRLVIQPGRFSR